MVQGNNKQLQYTLKKKDKLNRMKQNKYKVKLALLDVFTKNSIHISPVMQDSSEEETSISFPNCS